MRKFQFFCSLILTVLIILPILFCAWYLYSFSVNVPFWDQWVEIFFIRNFVEHHLSLSTLFMQVMDSRPVFPTLFALFTGTVMKYDVRFEVFIIFVLFISAFVSLVTMYAKDHGLYIRSLMFFIPVSWFFFNFYLISNFLMGIHVSQALVILALLCAVMLLDRCKTFNVNFFLAVGASIIATYSFIAGLLVWPACAILLLLQNGDKKFRLFLTWVAVSLVMFFVYFQGYHKPDITPPIGASISSPFITFAGFVTSVGSPVTHNPFFAPLAGILLLVLAAGLLINNRKDLCFDTNGKWIAILAFSLFVSGAIVAGRGGWGSDVGLAARYFLITFPGIIGLYCISLNYSGLSPKNRDSVQDKIPGDPIRPPRTSLLNVGFTIVALLLLLTGICSHVAPGLKEGNDQLEFYENASYLLKTHEFQSNDTLKILYPHIPFLLEWTAFLENNHLSVFTDEYPDLKGIIRLNEATQVSVERVNGIPVSTQSGPVTIDASKNATFSITGLAVDSRNNSLADAVFVCINGETDIPARYPLKRDGIQAGTGDTNVMGSGFAAYFSVDNFRNGMNNLTIKILASDKSGYYESAPLRIIVVKEKREF